MPSHPFEIGWRIDIHEWVERFDGKIDNRGPLSFDHPVDGAFAPEQRRPQIAADAWRPQGEKRMKTSA